jgi:uncharacterized protein (TIGR02270 family)
MPKIIPEIVTQQAEEAAFLWLLRDAAVGQPHYALADVAKLDGRVEAHLDGLRISGDEGYAILKKQLQDHTEAGEIFAAAVLAFESGKDDRIQEVFKLGTKSVQVSRGLVSAIGWLPYERAEKIIQRLLAAEAPALRRVGIAGSAVHRQHPRRELESALSHADPFLKSRALRAVGELALVDVLPAVRKNIKSDQPDCRFWAAWSAAVLSADSDAISVLQAIAESASRYRMRALQVSMRRLPLSAALTWQKGLAQQPNKARLTVVAVGVIGDPTNVPWLIEQMRIPVLARVAGEALSMITNVHISYDNLEGEKPEGFESGPTENPQDDNVTTDEDSFLAWPKAEAVQKWWNAKQKHFAMGTRYLAGKPINDQSLFEVLCQGRQRQRAAAALERAIRQKGSPLFEVRAPGFRQQKILAELDKK